jgi:peptidyl-prolyl cis-trans isomerase C
MNQLQDRILDDLINRELLYQAGQQKGISVSPEEARSEIDGMKKKFEKAEDFAAALKSLQMTEDQMAASIQRDMTVHRFVQEEILAGVVVTDEEKHEFYDSHPEFFKTPEQVRASHILAKLDETAGDDDQAAARKKIEDVNQKLKNGEDFAETAKTYSEGPSAAQGGDLGYFARGQMVPSFEEAAFALDVGAMSGIVQTRFGYHIILCTDRKPAGTASYEAEAEKISQHLQQAKSEKAVSACVEGLREAAKIEKLP